MCNTLLVYYDLSVLITLTYYLESDQITMNGLLYQLKI